MELEIELRNDDKNDNNLVDYGIASICTSADLPVPEKLASHTVTNKKLLLIKPNYEWFPLGLAYVCRDLQINGINFDFVDLSIVDDLRIKERLDTGEYFAVATGGLSADWEFMCKLRKEVKDCNDDIFFILGGSVVKDTMYTNKNILFDDDKFGIDFGVHGEAEGALAPLLHAIINNDTDYSKLRGIVYFDKKSGKPKKNPKDRFNLLSDNRFPLWDFIDVEHYKHAQMPFIGDITIMPMITARGCKGVCSFCSPTVGTFKERPIGHSIAEIEWLISNYDFELLVFMNEMFFDTKEDVLEFCAEYKKRFSKPWFCAFRAEIDIDVETFKIMKDAGCIQTSAGIESGSDKVLDLMKKLTPVKKIRSFYKDARSAGISIAGGVIVGNEGETEEELAKTIDMIIEDDIYCGAALMDAYPGTLAYKNALRRGLITDEWYHLTHSAFRSSYSMWGEGSSWVTTLSSDGKNEYVNVSDIPNEVFWPTIYRQLRRLETHNFNKYPLKKMKFNRSKSVLLRHIINVNGECTECGSNLSKRIKFDIMGGVFHCNDCHVANYVHYYKDKVFIDYHDFLTEQLHNSTRIVFIGLNKSVIKHDLFKINYDNSVLGLIDPDQLDNFYPYAKNELDVTSLTDLNPDCIFIVDDKIGNVEFEIKLRYIDAKINQPNIIHALPDSMRPLIYFLRYADSLNNVHLSKIICLIISSYMRLEYKVLSQISPDEYSTTRRIIKKIIPKSARIRLLHVMRAFLGMNVVRSTK